jgi:Flp pilus assembly protein TadG
MRDGRAVIQSRSCQPAIAMPQPAALARFAHRLLRHRGGAAGVEFALLLPTLVILLIGALDVGTLTFQEMQVTAAAHAGAQYALRNGWNQTGIQNAVVNATSLTVTASPAPQLLKACIVGGVVTTVAGATCSGGGSPGNYVQVNAQAAVSPLIVWSAIVMPSTLSAQAMIRIQ